MNNVPWNSPNLETDVLVHRGNDHPVADLAPTRSGPPRGLPRPLPSVPGLRIVRELGHGGMGEVYEAINDKLGVTYALKMIRRDRVSIRFVERFRREAKAMLELEHPHIARIYDYAEIDDGPYFTMKYCADGTLENRKEALKADLRQTVVVITEVSDALHYLHEQGYIHRDLKPQNILFQGDQPIISDFGLAKEHWELDDRIGGSAPFSSEGPDPSMSQLATQVKIGEFSPNGARQTASGAMIGTLPYMSPEQIRGPREQVTRQTDIWALGVMLYELVCGHRPFDSEDREVLSELIKQDQPDPPMREGMAIDGRLARIIDKCLAKKPVDRYATAAMLARDLRKWLAPVEPVRHRWIYPLAAAVGVLLLLPLVVPSFVPAPEKPAVRTQEDEENRQRILLRETLAAGKTFTLLGDKGLPVTGVRFPIAGRAGEMTATQEGMLLESVGRSMAELIDDPGVEEYIFRVQVRQKGFLVPDVARVGVYVGHQALQLPTGDLHTFGQLGFTEQWQIAQQPDRGEFRFAWVGQFHATNDVIATENHWYLDGGTFQRKFDENMLYLWHDLKIEVRRHEFSFQFDDQIVKIPRQFPRKWPLNLELVCGVKGLIPGSAPTRAGLGLFVLNGTAVFKNARIEPIRTD